MDNMPIPYCLIGYMIQSKMQAFIECGGGFRKLMNPQIWIGLGFGALFFVFLMIAFFATKNLTQGQHFILRIMSSFCAGIASGLIVGDASIQVSQALPGGKITGGFTAGLAMLIAVMLLFPRYKPSVPPQPPSPPPEGEFNFSVPVGWSFRDGIEGVARQDSATVSFRGFTKEELESPLQARQLNSKSATEALKSMRTITVTQGKVRQYDVQKQGSEYVLSTK